MNDKETEGCLVVMLGLGYLIPGVLLAGWAFMLLWGWFVVPLGIASLSFAHAIGLAMFVSLFTTTVNSNNTSDDALTDTLTNIFIHIFRVLTFLGMGIIIVQFL